MDNRYSLSMLVLDFNMNEQLHSFMIKACFIMGDAHVKEYFLDCLVS